MIHIELLPQSKFEVIRTLRLRGPQWQEFTGSISYSRPLTKTYNAKTTDVLDEAILESLGHYFIEVTQTNIEEVIFTHQQERVIAPLRRYPRITVNFQFTPYIEPEDAPRLFREGTELYAYPVEINLTVFYTAERELSTLPTFFLCSVPYEQLTPQLIKTIKPVQF